MGGEGPKCNRVACLAGERQRRHALSVYHLVDHEKAEILGNAWVLGQSIRSGNATRLDFAAMIGVRGFYGQKISLRLPIVYMEERHG
jgi:hypothetical protein